MLFKGDTIRLVHGLPELSLPKHAQGTVTRTLPIEEGQEQSVEVRFHANSPSRAAIVPRGACQLVLDRFHSWTAVFWALEKPPEKYIEDAVDAMLHHDFEMRAGLNAAQLVYDQNERFWLQKEPFHDSTGAEVVSAGPSWNGVVAAFSGDQRFQLEFRVAGRQQPVVFLHQRLEAYQEQRLSTHHAMSLLRVLLNLHEAMGARYCAAPVASNWLLDESWDSLLREPYFPDLFLIPRENVPGQLPPLFRTTNLANDAAILTTLPVKFSPSDEIIKPTKRDLKLNQLRASTAIGEKAYDQLYETTPSGSPSSHYSDAKEAFHEAMHIAKELGLHKESAELSKRLEHIKAVFRSQFS